MYGEKERKRKLNERKIQVLVYQYKIGYQIVIENWNRKKNGWCYITPTNKRINDFKMTNIVYDQPSPLNRKKKERNRVTCIGDRN